ncbi:MAG: hypothetical protein PHC99_10940 [Methylococcales bacterium]|nr:hypothetical protein [Methylococcales bacterium]
MKRFIFLMLMGLSFNSFAHDDGGVLSEDVTAVDYFMVSCSEDSDRMYFKISTPTTTPLLSAQVMKGNFVTNIPTSRGGVEILQGGGNYRILVNKNGAGKVGYAFEYHCENGGEHTETSINQLQ